MRGRDITRKIGSGHKTEPKKEKKEEKGKRRGKGEKISTQTFTLEAARANASRLPMVARVGSDSMIREGGGAPTPMLYRPATFAAVHARALAQLFCAPALRRRRASELLRRPGRCGGQKHYQEASTAAAPRSCVLLIALPQIADEPHRWGRRHRLRIFWVFLHFLYFTLYRQRGRPQCRTHQCHERS